MEFGPQPSSRLLRRAAVYIDKIANGATATLPVEGADRVESSSI